MSCVACFKAGTKDKFTDYFRDTPETERPMGFCCVVLQAATSSECEEIVNRIGESDANIKFYHKKRLSKSLLCECIFFITFLILLQLLGSNIQNGLCEEHHHFSGLEF